MLGRVSPPISLRERETTSSSHRGAGNRRTTPCGQRRRSASYSSSGSAFLICRLTSPGLIPGPTNWFPVTSATASASTGQYVSSRQSWEENSFWFDRGLAKDAYRDRGS